MKAYVVRIDFKRAKPPIWRRVIIPEETTFEQLHYIIQLVTNFGSEPYLGEYHLYEFGFRDSKVEIVGDEEIYQEFIYRKEERAEKAKRMENWKPTNTKEYLEDFVYQHFGQITGKDLEEKYGQDWREMFGLPAPYFDDEREMYLANSLYIDQYLENYNFINYAYDFGDGWELKIKLEKTIDDYDKPFATLIKGRLNAPPEDVGGMYGYKKFLEAIADKKHPDYEELLEWSEIQGYKEFDIDEINEELNSFTYKDAKWYQKIIESQLY